MHMKYTKTWYTIILLSLPPSSSFPAILQFHNFSFSPALLLPSASFDILPSFLDSLFPKFLSSSSSSVTQQTFQYEEYGKFSQNPARSHYFFLSLDRLFCRNILSFEVEASDFCFWSLKDFTDIYFGSAPSKKKRSQWVIYLQPLLHWTRSIVIYGSVKLLKLLYTSHTKYRNVHTASPLFSPIPKILTENLYFQNTTESRSGKKVLPVLLF